MVRSKLCIVFTIATSAVGAIAASGASAQRLVTSHPVVKPINAPTLHVGAPVRAYSTGEAGAASDETCAGFAKDENDAIAQASSEADMGDWANELKWYNTAKSLEDYAMDNGCFIVDPME